MGAYGLRPVPEIQFADYILPALRVRIAQKEAESYGTLNAGPNPSAGTWYLILCTMVGKVGSASRFVASSSQYLTIPDNPAVSVGDHQRSP